MLGCTTAFAQTLKGIVVDGETGKKLPGVIVANESAHYTAYTDANGEFIITAKRGDQVIFSLPGYKTQQKSVPASLGVADMHIEMFRLSYELEEFILRPQYTPYQLDSIERHSTYTRALARRKGGSIMSPVTWIAEKFSKRSKQIFRFQKNFSYWEDNKFIESRYTPVLVQQLTHLSGDTLAWFMNANPMPYDYVRTATDLELKMWIREQYREWMKHPQYPALISSDTVIHNQ